MDQEVTKEEPQQDIEEGKIIRIDEGQIREHLSGMVLRTVEETLNALLDEEADRLCGARKYERRQDRKDTRAQASIRGSFTPRPGK